MKAFWRAPDEFLLDAGRSAELRIAQLRVAVTVAVLLFPGSALAVGPAGERAQHVAGALIALVAVGVALGILIVVVRGRRHPWLPATTTLADVTLITLALLAHAVVHDPGEAVGSTSGFELYFLALGATCLRYDARVALVAGAAAIAEYLGVVAFAVGVLGYDLVASTPDRLPWSEQVSRVLLLAGATVLCVIVIRGLERQRRLSTTDPLTGIFNRGFFDDYLASEVARAERYRTPFALAMIDVDHFKGFNDAFGHPAGDRALRMVARLIRHAVRRSDVTARYGGEEFVVIFREVGAEDALERVEEIRRAVEGQDLNVGRLTTPARVTVSAGVSSWPEDGLTADEIVGAADQRLFEAKNSGRNLVVGPPSDRTRHLAPQ